jgi:glucokinase
MPRIAFGVDAGGTFTKIAAVAVSGRVLRLEELPTDPACGPAAFVDRVTQRLAGWTRQGLRAEAFGLGLAGDVDHGRGTLRVTPNLRGWDGHPFRADFRKRLRLPVIVENDANAAVWGAYATELKRGPAHVIGVTLGTGVGGGIIIGGRLHRGASGTAGEIGHTRVAVPGELCHCGSRGCLEAYAGNYGIVRTARKLLRARPGRGRILRRLCQEPAALSPKILKLAADQGDALAREVWQRTGNMLGLGLADVVMVLNPEVLMLLGGVSQAGTWLLDPIRRVFQSHPFGTSLRRVALRRAGNHNGGCVGAALLALEDAACR